MLHLFLSLSLFHTHFPSLCHPPPACLPPFGFILQTTADPLVWMLAAGGHGQGMVYEDDGDGLDFKTGSGATTVMQFTKDGKQLAATVSATNGTFDGIAATRAQWLVLHGVSKIPASASCDGKALGPTAAGAAPGFWVVRPGVEQPPDSEIMVSAASLVVACGPAELSATRKVLVTWN